MSWRTSTGRRRSWRRLNAAAACRSATSYGTNGAGLQWDSTCSKVPHPTKEMCMPTLAADVLLLTATPVESKATLQAFAAATPYKAVPQSLDGRIYFDLGT